MRRIMFLKNMFSKNKFFKKKISKLFIFQTLIFLTGLSILGFYTFKNYLPKDRKELVLGVSSGPITPEPIDTYILKNTIREACDDTQSKFSFSCTSGNGSSTINNAIKPYYGNPVLEDIEGRPLLFYYGGIHEVVLGNNPKVVTITRTISTTGTNPATGLGYYTAGCDSGWFPASTVRKDNFIFFGGGGLENLYYNRCYERASPQGDWGTTYTGTACYQTAINEGIRVIPGCKATLTESCWDKKAQCLTIGGGIEYYRVPSISRVKFAVSAAPSALGNHISVAEARSFIGKGTGGAGIYYNVPTYCRGKTKDGNCAWAWADLSYADNLGMHWGIRADYSSFADYLSFGYDIGAYSKDWLGRPINNPKKFFEKKVWYGLNTQQQQSYDHEKNLGGIDTPEAVNKLKNRFDVFYAERYYLNGKTQISKFLLDYYMKSVQNWPLPDGWEYVNDWGFWNSSNIVYGVIADYVSNNYFYSLQYINNTLYLKRIKATGYLAANPTTITTLSLPGISLKYTRNITFNITSGDDIDFMISPTFAEASSTPSSEARMFRALNFNSASSSVEAPYKLYELDEANGGYKFPTVAPGNNTPLSFRYYKINDTDLANDYAIFVSKNYVFTSNIPAKPTVCTVNPSKPILVNTHPGSINNGIKTKSYDSTSGTGYYDLIFSLPSVLTLNCPSSNLPVPIGTELTLSLFDGLTSEPVYDLNGDPLQYKSKLQPGGKGFSFANLEINGPNKYYYEIGFNHNGLSYYMPSQGVESTSYYTIDGGLGLNLYSIFPDALGDTNLYGAKLTITKNLGSNSRVYNLVSPANPINTVDLSSTGYTNFFWDHNLISKPAAIVDQVTYKICPTSSVNSKIVQVGLDGITSPTARINEYITAKINTGCLDVFYTSSTPEAYTFTAQSLDLYISNSELLTPISYSNFQFNGNVYIAANSGGIADSLVLTQPSDKVLEGILITRDAAGASSVRSASSVTFSFNFPSVLPTSLLNFTTTSSFTNKFNFAGGSQTLDANPIPLTSSSYIQLPSSSSSQNAYEIIALGQGKAIKIDLNNTNISNKLDKYIIINLDKSNFSRVQFVIDCNQAAYSQICSGAQFIMKGSLIGPFNLKGNIPSSKVDYKFINITENPDLMVNLMKDMGTKKYQIITKTKVNLKYSQ